MNSIDKNTNASVFFHLVTDKPGAVHIRLWMERARELQHIKKEIIVFDKSLIEGKYVASSRVSYRVGLLSDPVRQRQNISIRLYSARVMKITT